MSLVTREAPALITMKTGIAEICTCPFIKTIQYDTYSNSKCTTVKCMAWVTVVDTTSNDSGICPDGYVELTDSEFDAIYGGRPKEPKMHYFKKDLMNKEELGYCLRLKGCL